MIVPEGADEMTDDELVAQLVADGVYDQAEAEDAVYLLRHPDLVPE